MLPTTSAIIRSRRHVQPALAESSPERLTWDHTFSPTLTNEVLVNASRDYHWRGSGDFHTDYASALGCRIPFDAFNWPSFIGTWDLGAYPFGSQAPFWLITNYGLIQDNATKIHGKHEFQFGFHVKLRTDRQVREFQRRAVQRQHSGDCALRPLLDRRQSSGHAADRLRSGQFGAGRPELQRHVPAPLVPLPPAGILSVFPGQLEGHAAADSESGTCAMSFGRRFTTRTARCWASILTSTRW